jgi:hypothetical protein
MPPQSDSTSFGAKNRVDTVLKHLLLINGDEVECVEPPSAQQPKCASDCCLRLARNFYLPPCPFKVCHSNALAGDIDAACGSQDATLSALSKCLFTTIIYNLIQTSGGAFQNNISP